ncbi:uncharacterized protein LOC129285521 [Prosopis cineraria]|uniref:uncharacterized protein LOC129285521 n=1 Tax=Prosopis cineraria TaxID=364024 RepID=UPI00240EB894|nr:uncharacterized protein LOC129285521 [Prosopis cineraria]XP_054777234.1 uncharacterized protein LOC129285521 [Prosopis cineraria]
MKLGCERYMWRWIRRVSGSGVQHGLEERLRRCLSESALGHVKGIILEDIIEHIINGDSIISEQVPPPILDLSYRLAVDQLVQFLSYSYDHFKLSMPVVEFLTRNDLEKRTVVEDIKENFQIGETFEILQIINLHRINEEFRYFNVSLWTEETDLVLRRSEGYDFEVLKLPGQDKSHRKLMLLVDGDGDKRGDLQKVYIPLDIRYSKHAVVIITTGSSTLQNDELASEMDVRIRTEDHVLPWEVFCKNVGRELLYSSSAIQRVAVQIVEECGGHLLAIVFAAKSLKHVEDVQIWEQTLQKLRFIVGYHKLRIISRVLPAIEEKFVASNGSLRFVNGEDFPNEVMLILSKAWAFFLDRHMTIKNLSQFGWSNLNQLRLCILAECNEMQSIVDGDEDLESSFGELQFLSIFYMKNLTSIINRETLGNYTFCKLKFLALHTCTELTTIFTKDVLYNFSHLEELIVEDCPKVRSIITYQSLGETTSIFLPRLRKLSLLFVPELVSISSGVSFGRNLERIGFYYCPKLKSLSSKELLSQKLKHIMGEFEWWDALTWSEAEWGQEGRPDKFNHIFFTVDEDLDILTQLTTYEVDAVGRTRQ